MRLLDLGVVLHHEHIFAPHISALCHSKLLSALPSRVISSTLSPEAASALVHAFVVFRLDYCCIWQGIF